MTRLQIFICVIEAVTWVGIVYSLIVSWRARRSVRKLTEEMIERHERIRVVIAAATDSVESARADVAAHRTARNRGQ